MIEMMIPIATLVAIVSLFAFNPIYDSNGKFTLTRTHASGFVFIATLSFVPLVYTFTQDRVVSSFLLQKPNLSPMQTGGKHYLVENKSGYYNLRKCRNHFASLRITDSHSSTDGLVSNHKKSCKMLITPEILREIEYSTSLERQFGSLYVLIGVFVLGCFTWIFSLGSPRTKSDFTCTTFAVKQTTHLYEQNAFRFIVWIVLTCSYPVRFFVVYMGRNTQIDLMVDCCMIVGHCLFFYCVVAVIPWFKSERDEVCKILKLGFLRLAWILTLRYITLCLCSSVYTTMIILMFTFYEYFNTDAPEILHERCQEYASGSGDLVNNLLMSDNERDQNTKVRVAEVTQEGRVQLARMNNTAKITLQRETIAAGKNKQTADIAAKQKAAEEKRKAEVSAQFEAFQHAMALKDRDATARSERDEQASKRRADVREKMRTEEVTDEVRHFIRDRKVAFRNHVVDWGIKHPGPNGQVDLNAMYAFGNSIAPFYSCMPAPPHAGGGAPMPPIVD